MPMYEYHCEKCGKTTEALRAMSQADTPIACSHCGSMKTSRQLSVFAAAGSTSSAGSSTSLPMGGCCPCGKNQGSCSN